MDWPSDGLHPCKSPATLLGCKDFLLEEVLAWPWWLPVGCYVLCGFLYWFCSDQRADLTSGDCCRQTRRENIREQRGIGVCGLVWVEWHLALLLVCQSHTSTTHGEWDWLFL